MLEIDGLSDEDSVELWRAFEVSGSRHQLLPVFNTFRKHPLLIQALAGVVRRYRRAPGNFELWNEAHPRFDPTQFNELTKAMKHVLEFALQGLDKRNEKTLQTIAAFRMPTGYDALVALLVGEGKACRDEDELDDVLSELEDRGLLGWDRRNNCYDLHPNVRSVVWKSLNSHSRASLHALLRAHFETRPMIDDYHDAHRFEDIRPLIELYHILIELHRYDEAAELFLERLERIAFYRVTANRQIVDLLLRLFPEQSELPYVTDVTAQIGILIALANAHAFTGFEQKAGVLYERANKLCEQQADHIHHAESLQGLAFSLRRSGRLYDAEVAARKAVLIARCENDAFWEARSLRKLGLIMASRGMITEARQLLNRAVLAFLQGDTERGRADGPSERRHWVGATFFFLGRCDFWSEEFEIALVRTKTARDLVEQERCEPCSMSTKRLEGLCALARGNLETADQHLRDVLKAARNVKLPRLEIETLEALANLRWIQKDFAAAHEYLNGIWEYLKGISESAGRGPYPLVRADAFNILAQVERDEGNVAAAIDAATEAYRFAWCDGPPFAYHWGLEKAKKHLKELGTPEPEMPPFDESKFEPMPEVEIDPEDEFHVGADPAT